MRIIIFYLISKVFILILQIYINISLIYWFANYDLKSKLY